MNKSDSIKNLSIALCNAQNEMGGAVKDSKNPFFNSKYADLSSIIKAIKEPFCKHGLSYSQFPISNEEGNIGVETILMHESGEWMSHKFYLSLTKKDPQGGGSAITYARRYALQSMAGIPTKDDDGNTASNVKAIYDSYSEKKESDKPKYTTVLLNEHKEKMKEKFKNGISPSDIIQSLEKKYILSDIMKQKITELNIRSNLNERL